MASLSRAIDDFCRLCAVESQSGVTIYSTEGENLCLEEKIISCLRIEVSRDDLLPKRICQSCNLLLEDYYRFSERATQVQQTLYLLLGLHLPHSHEVDSEICLMNDDVKVESNMIKKEVDEFIAHHSSIVHLDSEKFDLLTPSENFVRDQIYYSDIKNTNKQISLSLNTEDGKDITIVESNETVKQLHRRKMSLPKKSIKDKSEDRAKSNDAVFLTEEIHESQDYFINHNYGHKNSYEDLNKKNFDVELLSSEEEEENEGNKMSFEWNKKWGILCNQCKNILYDRLQFDSHYRNLHNQQPVYTCSLCKESLDRHSSYKLHIIEHINTGRFKCKFCVKKFCAKEMLQIHLEYFHNQVNIHICEYCGKSFTTQFRLDFHLKKHTTHSNEKLQCLECGKILQTRGGLAAHKSVHKLGRHYMCHICGKTFTQKINMQQHVKHHKGERPHICEICKKSFAEKSHLKRHKSFHAKDRLFQCSLCKKMYKTERCLKVHSQTHWNSRPYICSFCGKGFLSSTKLKEHHNCHTGERPFACKYCEKTFTNYPNWMKHTRRRHKVDHKTGLSLKEENQTSNLTVPQLEMPQGDLDIPHRGIEFIEISDVEVKEDGRDSVQSQNSVFSMIPPTILSDSQLQIVEEDNCHYQMNLLSSFTPSQMVYTDQVYVPDTTLM